MTLPDHCCINLEPRRLGPWRHLYLQSGPSERRFAARASFWSGRCLGCQDRHDHLVPALCRASRKLARIWLAPQALGSISPPYHRPRSRRRAAGWGRVAGGQTVAEEPGVHIRHQRPVGFGQHLQRLPPGRQAKAARPGSRSRRYRPGAAWADAPRRGITYARFRFSGCPSRWRSQRGRTVRQ
jgi:hypothetical protein